MAFWMDPFILVACGVAIVAVTERFANGNVDVLLGLGFLTQAIAYGIAIGLFVNASILEPVWSALGADTGTEFMINGIVLAIADPGTVYADIGTVGMFIAILAFTTYPLYLIGGIVIGRLLVDRLSDEHALAGLLRPNARD